MKRYMTAKEYLLQIRDINARLKQLEAEISDVEARLGVQGISYDKISSTPSDEDKMTRYVIRLIELKDKYEAEGNKLLDKKEEITNTIARVADFRKRQVLYYRYVLCYKWEDIAEQLGYDDRYLFKLHGYALDEIRTLKDSIKG